MATDHAQYLSDEGFHASATALDTITTETLENHTAPPFTTLHRPSPLPESHSFLARIIHPTTIEQLETRFHMGNYVIIDRKERTREFEPMSIYVRVGMHLLYYGSEQEKALHWQRTLDLLKAQSEKMGKEYDSRESKEHIPAFIKSFALEDSLAEMVKPNPSEYETFNEFFAREIRADRRPVAEPENELVTSSPADCRLTAFPTVDLATKYWIKGFGFTLERLFNDKALAKKFDGGSLLIARLAPQDYHRWHSPITGTIKTITEVPGAYYTVNPQAINEPGTLDVFCENRRSVMTLIHTATGRPCVVVAVGAMLVGSIKYCYAGAEANGAGKTGVEVKRGECLGKFLYGGSTVIVCYPPGDVKLDEDLVKNSIEDGVETLMRVGWRTGICVATKEPKGEDIGGDDWSEELKKEIREVK